MQHKSWGRSLGFLRVAASSNSSINRTRLRQAGYLERVCRAWHVTMSVEVRQPGLSRAEG